MSKIAVVIPIHNGLEDTKLCLKSIYAALKFLGLQKDIYIIVVDDGSTDGSSLFIKINYPDIIILKGDGNLWWSGAVNLAVKYALKNKTTHVLLFNNDNIIEKNYFQALYKSINNFGSNVIIASKVVNLYPEHHIKYAGEICDRQKGKFIKNPNPNKTMKVNSAGGMGVLIPTFLFNRIGFFDLVNFPQAYGDADFYLRAENCGFVMYYEPKMIVYNNNNISGFKSNATIRDIIRAYSYPKGYMNIKIDAKFYFKYFNFISSIFILVTKNIRFCLGFLKKAILKSKIKS